MAKRKTGGDNPLWSIGIALAVTVALVLVYGLVVGVVAPRVDPVRVTNPADLEGTTIQIEILNGCGIDNLAAEARTHMRRRGFDVVGVGNYASQDVDTSFVVDHTGDLQAARKVASAIGIPVEHIRQETEEDALLDATVVIGRDYESLFAFAERDEN